MQFNKIITSLLISHNINYKSNLDIPHTKTYFQEPINKAAEASLQDMKLLWFITFIIAGCVTTILFSIFFRQFQSRGHEKFKLITAHNSSRFIWDNNDIFEFSYNEKYRPTSHKYSILTVKPYYFPVADNSLLLEIVWFLIPYMVTMGY